VRKRRRALNRKPCIVKIYAGFVDCAALPESGASPGSATDTKRNFCDAILTAARDKPAAFWVNTGYSWHHSGRRSQTKETSMNRILLVLLLTMVSTSAMAEWVRIGIDSKATYYVNPDSVRKYDDRANLWRLSDFKSGKAYRSSKSNVEFDCKASQFRTLFYSLYSKSMGEGKTVYSNGVTQKWGPIPPGSAMEYYFQLACGEK
jgi:Surface-adhesin protein E